MQQQSAISFAIAIMRAQNRAELNGAPWLRMRRHNRRFAVDPIPARSRTETRDFDTAFASEQARSRLGGEEVPRTSQPDAVAVAERIRSGFEVTSANSGHWNRVWTGQELRTDRTFRKPSTHAFRTIS
jgi:hypothetical protein